jgi:hypothetical protein
MNMELYRSRLRRPRFHLAEVAGLVAALAVALRWPILLLPTLSAALAVSFVRLGLSLIWVLVLMSALLFVLGLCMGFIA